MNEGWCEVRLGEVLALDNRKLGEHTVEPEVLSLSKYDGFVRASEYFDKRIASSSLDGYKVVEAEGWAYSTIHIDEGSIARNTLGIMGVISPMYTTLSWTSGDHDPAFFAHLLRSGPLMNLYRANAQGSINRRRSLSYKTFAGMRVSVPPWVAQRRIVDLIEHLDSQDEALATQVDGLSALRSAVYRSSLAASGKTCALGSLVDVAQGKSLPKSIQGSATGSIPWFKIADMARRDNLDGYQVAETTVTEEEIAHLGGRVFPSRTVTFPRVGAAVLTEKKRILDVAAALDENHIALVPHEGTDPECLLSCLEEMRLSDLVRTGAVPSLNMRLIREVQVAFPGKSMQEGVGKALAAIRVLRREMRRELNALRQYRESVLSALLQGDTTIPDSYEEVVEVAS